MDVRSSNDALVKFREVQKSYDGKSLVVQSLDLDVQRGEFLTLLGPSGSGKTTTLMMLAGFENPTSGSITLDGKDVTRLPPHKRGIGVVFQNYALFPHMTIAENVAYPLRIRKVQQADRDRRVRATLAKVRLEDFADRRPSQLSGGQQQRAALARALVFQPELILLDEPLGALDRQLREELQIELKHLHRELGVTMVYVTHDQTEALTMSDRIAIFDGGRIQQVASPLEIYDEPDNSIVAGFLGENNMLEGIVTSCGDGRVTIRLSDGTEIIGLARRDLPLDSPAIAAIRPECIRVLSGNETGENTIEGVVRETIYLGDAWRIALDLADGSDLTMRLDRTALAQVPEAGQRLHVAWPISKCRALPCQS